jgi:CP family cyanate transporter-like MFS transporter
MALAAFGLLFRSLCGDTIGLLLGSIVALSGMGIGNVVLPPVVKRYFPDRIGTVSTAYIACLQLGTILPALFAVPLAEAVGWRVSLGSWSLVALAAAVPWIVVLRIERRAASPLAKAHDRAVTAGDEAPELPAASGAGRVWRSPVAWSLALMFATTSSIVYSIFTWLPKLLVEAGGSPALGGAMLALFSCLGLLGALCTPAIAVRVANPFPIVAFCGLAFLGGFAGLLWVPMTFTALWVALIGAGPGTFPLTLTLINLRTRTDAGSAALSGFVQGLGYTLSCPAPLVFGILHESTSGWACPMALLSGCALVLLISGYVACRPRILEDTW